MGKMEQGGVKRPGKSPQKDGHDRPEAAEDGDQGWNEARDKSRKGRPARKWHRFLRGRASPSRVRDQLRTFDLGLFQDSRDERASGAMMVASSRGGVLMGLDQEIGNPNPPSQTP